MLRIILERGEESNAIQTVVGDDLASEIPVAFNVFAGVLLGQWLLRLESLFLTGDTESGT